MASHDWMKSHAEHYPGAFLDIAETMLKETPCDSPMRRRHLAKHIQTAAQEWFNARHAEQGTHTLVSTEELEHLKKRRVQTPDGDCG